MVAMDGVLTGPKLRLRLAWHPVRQCRRSASLLSKRPPRTAAQWLMSQVIPYLAPGPLSITKHGRAPAPQTESPHSTASQNFIWRLRLIRSVMQTLHFLFPPHLSVDFVNPRWPCSWASFLVYIPFLPQVPVYLHLRLLRWPCSFIPGADTTLRPLINFPSILLPSSTSLSIGSGIGIGLLVKRTLLVIHESFLVCAVTLSVSITARRPVLTCTSAFELIPTNSVPLPSTFPAGRTFHHLNNFHVAPSTFLLIASSSFQTGLNPKGEPDRREVGNPTGFHAICSAPTARPAMTSPPDGQEQGSPKPLQQRQRGPTISIDDSAVNPSSEEPPSAATDKPGPLPRIQTAGLDSGPTLSSPLSVSPTDGRPSSDIRESRPTSPHNVSSPRAQFLDWAPAQNFLAVPGSRARATSIESENSPTSEFGGETQIASTTSEDYLRKTSLINNNEVMNDAEALTPDPGTEADFQVEDNRFAFTPGHLNKMINPKSLAAFHALGGLGGLEKGLRTSRHSGLSVDEVGLSGTVDFQEAVQAGVDAEENYGTVKRTTTSNSMSAPPKTSENAFADRKRIFKDNRLPEKKAKTFWQLAWIAYNDKVLILLSVAAVISLALGIYQTVNPAPSEEHEAKVEWVEGVAIMVAIFVVTFVGALNDYQKERQFIKLNRKKEERFVKVIRSGKSQEISVYDVLVGDVMHLEPGDLIPVDGVFIEGHNVKCDESSATGESDIIRKVPADEVYHAIESHQNLKKMDPFILSGGKVSEGVGTFLVTSVGVNSSYGKTLMSLQDEGQTTPLQVKLNILAEYIAKLGLAAGLLLFVVLFIKFLVELKHIEGGAQSKGQRFLQIFIVAVTIIVVAVPEGLPLAVTLALAFATTRMLKDNNLVRLLRACETMGNATTVCSDKTGTLTQNKMTVVAGTLSTASRFGDKQQPINTTTAQNAKFQGVSEVANDVSAAEFFGTLSPDTKSLLKDSVILNSTAFEAEENGAKVFIGSKTETALLSFVTDHLAVESISEERANSDVVQMVPFDSGRKCMAVIVRLPSGKYRMMVKGASEILIAKCSRIVRDPTKELADSPITVDQVETLNSIVSNYASRSLRTIALLYRDFNEWPPRGAALPDDKKQADFDKIFKDMIFFGVVGIQDPLRPGVEKAVHDCQVAGVFVRMVTGDNIMTAKAIATECGIFTSGGIAMEGPVFRKLSSKQLNQVIPRLQVLARSSPDDKKLLVGHLKKLGETVAVTGDGTNDAPALKTADVGFSMGIAGTEVAKEASAIILMDDNFASIVKAISWGRTVNDAVKKFLQVSIFHTRA